MKLDKTTPERSADGSAAQPEQAKRRAPYLTANLFAACFGLAGLASAWTTLMRLVHGPDWPGNALSIVAALVWLITAIAYLGNVGAQHRWKQELSDQTLGPFASLIFIVPVLLSVPLAQQARGAGEVVFGCATALTVLFGAWITGDWIARNGDIRRWHPGYYLPAAAGGLIAAGASAALGFTTLSHVLFGLGVGTYLLLGSIIGQRLFVVPEMPKALLPTIAIELAPSVVAADSWFAINGGRIDTTVAVISGFAVLMALAQLRLIPLYRTAPFGPAYWAFSFPAAAAVTCGLHWLGAERVPGATGLGYALVGLLSAGFLLLAARTVVALMHGTFILRVPVPAQAAGSLRNRPVNDHRRVKIPTRQVKFRFYRTVAGDSGAFMAPSTRGGPQAVDVAGRPMVPGMIRAMKPLPSSHVRIARPSRDLRRTERFWVDGLGLDVLYRADSSAEGGHALLMAGWPGAAWHLEFVDDRKGETPAAPTEEDLLVLYLDGDVEEGAINRLVDAGGTRVVSRNPYWDHGGVTIADPDGYRLVLTSRSWSSPVIAKDLCTYKIVILRQGQTIRDHEPAPPNWGC